MALIAVLIILAVFDSSSSQITIAANQNKGFRLTELKVPSLVDLREKPTLDCHYQMGSEELYSVKWYKDDREFFRFNPNELPPTLTFPVPGVEVELNSSCSYDHCSISLTNLSLEHSTGSYRCEVSTEAPFFKLASETKNITVAALPQEKLQLEGLEEWYQEGETIRATCLADFSDPLPILSWNINGVSAPLQLVSEPTTRKINHIGLTSRSINISIPVERHYFRNGNLDLQCKSSLPGVPFPPQTIKRSIPWRPLHVPKIQVEEEHFGFWYTSASAPLQLNRICLGVLLFCFV